MADWNTPTNASTYSSVLTTLNEKLANAAKMDFTGDTNVPTGAMRYNTGTFALERWSGAAWVEVNSWADWVPTYGATGSMTWPASTTVARFWRRGGVWGFYIRASGTTGGVADNGLTFTVPVTVVNYGSLTAAAAVYEGGSTQLAGVAEMSSSTTFLIRKYDGSNFGLGANRAITVMGIGEV